MWRVELHSHTIWSKDCIVRPETILRLMEERGIDRIAITDHNTAKGALEMQRAYPERVIVGEEIMTRQGELLGYFLIDTIPEGLSSRETIQRLRDQGAAISVSHPFDRLRKGAWRESDLMEILPYVDAIETFNARCLFQDDNARARQFAVAHDVIGTAGSDAHSRSEYGRAVMRMTPFSNSGEFIAALRCAEAITRYSSPIVHGHSTLAKWAKRLGLYRSLRQDG